MAAPNFSLPDLDFDELVELVRRKRGLFLRYSRGPEADLREGPSRDYEAGVQLPGWSVTTMDPEPWWTRPPADWIARRVCKYAELAGEEGRRPWLLTGTVAGYGPDHEPVVVDMSPVAWVSQAALDEALRRYRERYEVGKDSRGD